MPKTTQVITPFLNCAPIRRKEQQWYFSPEHASGGDIVRSPNELVERISSYLSGTAIDQNLQQARQQFIRKWCHTTDGNATRTMVEHIHNLLDHRNHDSKIPSKLKQRINYYLMTFGDHMGHDARVYGFMNTLSKNYVDKLDDFVKKSMNRHAGLDPASRTY